MLGLASRVVFRVEFVSGNVWERLELECVFFDEKMQNKYGDIFLWVGTDRGRVGGGRGKLIRDI